jgi:SAM-dependent methyltransferase
MEAIGALSTIPAARIRHMSETTGAPPRTSHRLLRWAFHRLTYAEPAAPENVADEAWLEQGLASTARFFSRLPDDLPIEGRRVLDLGCGFGTTCIHVAQRGARRVLGVDINDVTLAQRLLEDRFPELRDAVEFRQVGVEDQRLEGEQFDLILSKDTFEHVGDPVGYVQEMRRLLAPGGEIAIGFGPTWKSPYGGHLSFMTKLPWAQLIFPERIVLDERRRFRPEEDPARYEDVIGGLNRMTLARFEQVMRDSGLETRYLRCNASDGRMVSAMKVPSRVPALREYFTSNVYGVFRERAGASPAS